MRHLLGVQLDRPVWPLDDAPLASDEGPDAPVPPHDEAAHDREWQRKREEHSEQAARGRGTGG
jgi:hypothetical protein